MACFSLVASRQLRVVTRCWSNVGPPSPTSGQNWVNISCFLAWVPSHQACRNYCRLHLTQHKTKVMHCINARPASQRLTNVYPALIRVWWNGLDQRSSDITIIERKSGFVTLFPMWWRLKLGSNSQPYESHKDMIPKGDCHWPFYFNISSDLRICLQHEVIWIA